MHKTIRFICIIGIFASFIFSTAGVEVPVEQEEDVFCKQEQKQTAYNDEFDLGDETQASPFK